MKILDNGTFRELKKGDHFYKILHKVTDKEQNSNDSTETNDGK